MVRHTVDVAVEFDDVRVAALYTMLFDELDPAPGVIGHSDAQLAIWSQAIGDTMATCVGEFVEVSR